MYKAITLLLFFLTSGWLKAQLPELIPYRKGQLWGYSDSTKKIIIDAEYTNYDKDFAYKDIRFLKLFQNDSIGLYNIAKRKKIVPVRYKQIIISNISIIAYNFDNSFDRYTHNGNYLGRYSGFYLNISDKVDVYDSGKRIQYSCDTQDFKKTNFQLIKVLSKKYFLGEINDSIKVLLKLTNDGFTLADTAKYRKLRFFESGMYLGKTIYGQYIAKDSNGNTMDELVNDALRYSFFKKNKSKQPLDKVNAEGEYPFYTFTGINSTTLRGYDNDVIIYKMSEALTGTVYFNDAQQGKSPMDGFIGGVIDISYLNYNYSFGIKNKTWEGKSKTIYPYYEKKIKGWFRNLETNSICYYINNRILIKTEFQYLTKNLVCFDENEKYRWRMTSDSLDFIYDNERYVSIYSDSQLLISGFDIRQFTKPGSFIRPLNAMNYFIQETPNNPYIIKTIFGKTITEESLKNQLMKSTRNEFWFWQNNYLLNNYGDTLYKGQNINNFTPYAVTSEYSKNYRSNTEYLFFQDSYTNKSFWINLNDGKVITVNRLLGSDDMYFNGKFFFDINNDRIQILDSASRVIYSLTHVDYIDKVRSRFMGRNLPYLHFKFFSNKRSGLIFSKRRNLKLTGEIILGNTGVYWNPKHGNQKKPFFYRGYIYAYSGKNITVYNDSLKIIFQGKYEIAPQNSVSRSVADHFEYYSQYNIIPSPPVIVLVNNDKSQKKFTTIDSKNGYLISNDYHYLLFTANNGIFLLQGASGLTFIDKYGTIYGEP